MRAVAILMFAASTAVAEPTVKPADAVATLDAALAVAVDAKAPRAVTTSIALIEKATGIEIADVRIKIAKRPLTVIEERLENDVATITVQAKSGARGTITIGPEGGAITVTLRPTALEAPGACVAIPRVEHHVDVHASSMGHGEHHSRTINWSLDTSRLLDVDGDGVLDAFVPVAPNAHACPELVSYRVYLVRGTCGHEVGVVGPGSFAHDASKVPLAASGYRPLTMSSEVPHLGKTGIPEMTTSTRRFEVANNRYTQVDAKTNTGVCHHCATWRCTKR
jgi:hypothetical protein